MQQVNTCLFCGHHVQPVHVHGHYQCPVCTTNALPCCDGDNCDTNKLFSEQPKRAIKENYAATGGPSKPVLNETGL